MTKDELKQEILDNIKPNARREITGQKLQDVLLDCVDTIFNEIDPVFLQSPAAGITSADIDSWDAKASGADVDELRDDVDANTEAIAALREAYASIAHTDVVPVDSLPESGLPNTIYRVAGVNTFSDYMWDGSQWVLLYTQASSVDAVPSAGSHNLVESGGVYSEFHRDEVVAAKSTTPNAIIYADGQVASAGVTAAVVSTYEGDFAMKELKVSGRVGSPADRAMVAFYQSDGTFISSALLGNGTARSEVDTIVTAPVGTGVVKISGNTNSQSPNLKIDISLWEIAGGLRQDVDSLIEDTHATISAGEDARVVGGYLLSATGGVVSAASSAIINVYEGDYSGKEIIVSGRAPTNSIYAMVCFYDEDDDFISAALVGNGVVPVNYVDEVLTCPEGASVVKVAGNVNYQLPLLKEEYTLKELVLQESTQEEGRIIPILPALEYGALSTSGGGFSEMQTAAGGSATMYGRGVIRTPKYIQVHGLHSIELKSDRNVEFRMFLYNEDYSFSHSTDWATLTANTPTTAIVEGYSFARFHFREDSLLVDMPMFTLELTGAFSDDCEKFNIRSADDGYQTIAVGVKPINGGVSNADTNNVQDDETYATDYGILVLPPTYKNIGKPTRLIIYCHGAGINYGASTTRFPSSDCRPDYWLSEGYAVMDMDGEFFSTNHQHTYLPEARQSYVAAYHWLIDNYNIRKDGVFLGGRSMGGGMCFDLLESHLPVIAACPVVPVCNTLWWWNYSSATYRTDCANKMGFVGTHTWGGNDPMSQSDWDFLYANFTQMVKYSPLWRCIADLPSKDVLFNGTRIASSTTTGAAVEAEAAIFANLHARVKSPVKFFDCYADPTVPYERNALLMYKMLVNAGQITELRMFNTADDSDMSMTAHHFELRSDRLVTWTNSFGVTLQDVPVVYIEMLAFWRRYEQVNGRL